MIRQPMPEKAQERLIRSAFLAQPREICGFVLDNWGLVFMQNVAEKDNQFSMDDDALLEFYRVYSRQCMGMFHSHPNGRESPSTLDAEYAPARMRYWIITPTDVHEWDMEYEPPRPLTPGTQPILVTSNAEGSAPD